MLKLAKKVDYSLIALKHFALRQREGVPALSAKEVSENCGIPLPILSKLLQKLGKTGFLISAFGTNGGYRLARDPARITALEVILAIDGPIVLANCFTRNTPCWHSERCTVRRPLKKIHDGILQLLGDVSIEDMLTDPDEEEGATPVSPLVALEAGYRTIPPENKYETADISR
jgi:Rrf2 family protein